MKTYGLVRLTKDPETRYGANNTPICHFSIADNRSFKREGQPEADFFDCVAFNKKAEAIQNYLKKGSQILLDGEVQNDDYTNRDGQKVRHDVIIVNDFKFAGKKADNEGTAGGAPAAKKAQKPASKPAPKPAPAPAEPAGDGFMTIPEDLESELPFA